MTIAELVVALMGDDSDFKAKLKDAVESTKSAADKIGSLVKGSLAVAAFAGLATAIKGVIAQMDRLEDVWSIQASAVAKLDTVVRSTGASSWTSSEKLQSFASALQSVTTYGDESIISMQGVLLGFRNIQGTNFDRATKSILDMATVMGMDLTSAAQAVGKALDDPVTGMDSLSRQGFKFSDAEKAVLKSLVEAGKAAEAQDIILGELEKTYGGTSEAVASTSIGLKTQLKNALGDVGEEMGRSISNHLVPFRKAMLDVATAVAAVAKESNTLWEIYEKTKQGTATVNERLMREQDILNRLVADYNSAKKQSRSIVSQEELDAMSSAIAQQNTLVLGIKRQIEAEKGAADAKKKAADDAAAAEAEAKKAAEERSRAEIGLLEYEAEKGAEISGKRYDAMAASYFKGLKDEAAARDQAIAEEVAAGEYRIAKAGEIEGARYQAAYESYLKKKKLDEAEEAEAKARAQRMKELWAQATSDTLNNVTSALGSISAIYQADGDKRKQEISDELTARLSAIDAQIAARKQEGKDYADLEAMKAEATKAAEKEKAEAKYKADHASWEMSVAMSVIDGLRAAARAFADYPFPASLGISALAAAAAGLEIAALKKAEPTMPALASGTRFARGGATIVGEYGPELVDMPRGARVLPAHQTQAAARSGLGGGLSVTINSPKAVDVVEAARIMRRTARDLAWRGA